MCRAGRKTPLTQLLVSNIIIIINCSACTISVFNSGCYQ